MVKEANMSKNMTNPAKKVRTGSGDKIFYAISYTIIIILTISVLYPIVYCISASFSSADALMSGKVWLWPVEFNTQGYQAILKSQNVWIGYRNTIFYTVVGTLINVAMTLMCAYPLARTNLYGRGPIMFLFSFTMLFGGGMVPSYLLMKNLGLLNTVWVMLIPGAISVYNMIVARTFIQTSIPGELLESSKIDGCSDLQYFFKMVLPLSKSIIAVLTLWYAVGHWNAYFNAFLYLTDKELYPLQIFLRDLLISNNMASAVEDPEIASQLRTVELTLKYAMIVVATAPLFAVYPFVQKHFVKGVMIGSVKG